jgi:hypothetical protein
MAIQIQKPLKTLPFKVSLKKPWTVLILKTLEGGRICFASARKGYGSDP